MKKPFLALALTASLATPSIGHADPKTTDQAEILEAVSPGTTTSFVLESLGKPDRVEYVSDIPVWVYPYTEERFGPDVNGEIKLEITEKSTVGKVFNDQGGLGLWALTGFLFLAIIVI